MDIFELKPYYDIIISSGQACLVFDADLASNCVSHSYLLKCEDDITRQIFANYFAKRLICQNHNSGCTICDNIERGTHPDIMKLPEEDGGLKVEDSAKILNSVNFFGMEQEKKIYILDKFESATLQMQNKLLKVLEEPPENVYFLLMCKQDNGVINPIKSRCKKLYINSLSEVDLDNILSSLKVREQTRDIAKFIGYNYIGQTFEAIENRSLQNIMQFCFDMFDNLDNSKQSLKYSARLANLKGDIEKFLKIYALIISQIYYYKCVGKFRNKAFKNEFSRFANKFSIKGLISLQEKVCTYNEQIKRNCSVPLIADTICLDYLMCKQLK